AGQRAAHRADLHLLPRRIAGERRGFSLAVAVADRQSPGAAHLIDYFRVERFAGATDLTQADLESRELFLDEQPPHRRRRAQRGDAAAADGGKQTLGVEARLIDHEHGCAGVPWREETAPGVLGPARRGNVEMNVAGLKPEPVHGG